MFFSCSDRQVLNPYGIKTLNDLQSKLEKSLPNDNIVRLFDIDFLFDEVYKYPPQFHINLHKQIMEEIHKSKILKLKAYKSELSILTYNLGNLSSSEYVSLSCIPSEIATYSSNITGEIRFKGAILGKLPFLQKHGLTEDPILLKLKDSLLVSISCANKGLEKDLNYYFNRHLDNRHLCEIGIGTNLGLKYLHPINTLALERYPGFHLGFGGKSFESIHIDFIFDESEIMLENKLLFRDKQFIF